MRVLILTFVLVGTLSFAYTVNAEEACLRGGDGNCVEVAIIDTGTGDPTYTLGTSTSNSVIRLSDNTYVAAVAKYDSATGTAIRYEIDLYESHDLGLTWNKVAVKNKGSWYVDQINAGGIFRQWNGSVYIPQKWGAYYGTGFLGFSLESQVDHDTNKEYLVLTHTSVCSTTAVVESAYFFGEELSGCSQSGTADGVIWVDTISYDLEGDVFTQIGNTTSMSFMRGIMPTSGVGSCTPGGTCFSGGAGAYNSSVTLGQITSDDKINVWVSYFAYRGETCMSKSLYCLDQNLNTLVDVVPSQELWVRNFYIDTKTGALTEISNTQIEESKFDRVDVTNDVETCRGGTAYCLDERHSYVSVIRSTYNQSDGTTRPLLIYGYSRPGMEDKTNTDISKLRWAYWDGASWVKAGLVQDATGIWKNGSISTDLLAAFDPSNGAPDVETKVVSTLSAISSPTYSGYDVYPTPANQLRAHRVVHLTTIADLRDVGGAMIATPVYIHFTTSAPGAWDSPQGLILADDVLSPVFTNDGVIAIDAEAIGSPEVRPYFYNGGPSIQWNAQNVFVALPGAPVNDFKARNTDIYATRISTINWFADVSVSWLDNDDPNFGDSGTSNIPVYSQITPANRQTDGTTSERAFASPHLLNYGLQVVSNEDSSTLTNLNFPNMLFIRADFGDLDPKDCASGQPCLINFSGEQNLHSITGWAWADVVGWLSLSCRNLNSCAKKSEPWSTLDGGNYYGLRSVVNNDLPRNPVIGKVWSERVGFVSFSRKDSTSDLNLCGNPPGVSPGDDYYIDPNTCGYVLNGDFDEIDSVHNFYVENNATFPTSGYFVVDSEVFFYGVGSVSDCGLGGHCIRISGIVRGRENSAVISSQEFQNISRDHAEGTPIFFLGIDDPTAKATVADMYVGINHRDNTNFELEGWARALAWKDYQVTYCGGVIGPTELSPCDKEWGWIKLEGDWETIKRGTFDAGLSCAVGSETVHLDSVEGYPNPVETGSVEYIEIASMHSDLFLPPNPYPSIFTYTGIDFVNNALTGVKDVFSPIPRDNPIFGSLCSGNDGLSVPWVARLANGISDVATDIPIDSFSGFLPSGKAMIFWDEGLDGTINASEIIEYSQIDTNVSPSLLAFVTRDIGGTGAITFNNPTETFIRPLADVGKYNTFAIDVASFTPQKTLLGFGWSSPTTDSLTPDPFESRYRNSLAGFGWINFQPNRLEQIHPFLRTLFSNVYVGGNYELIGPNTNDSNEYTSTYLLQGKGFALPFLSGSDVSSRAYQDCLFNPPPQPEPLPSPLLTSEQLCSGLAPVSEAPTIELESGGLTIFGRLPSHDDIATWVRGCRDKDGTLVNGTGECPATANQIRKFSSLQSLDNFNSQAISDGNGAVSGINRFGHTVILCRATPSTNIGQYYAQGESKNIFTDNGWEGNPEECRWQESIGWDGSLGVDYDPAVGAPDDTKLCVKQTGGTLNSSGTITISDGISTENIGYVIAVADNCPDSIPAEPETELKLTAPLTTSFASGAAVNEISARSFYKVRHSPLGLPTVYIVPDDYGERGEDYMMLEFSSMPIQFNNGDKTFDWDTNDDGFLNDSIPDYNGNGDADEFEHGAVTFSVPGTLFFLDAQMRYCPTGIPGLPCESADDTEQDVSDIRQLASVGWLVDGTVGNLGGFASGYYSGVKSYLMGAFLIYGEESADRYCATGVPGPCTSTFAGLGRYGDFISHWQLAQGIQLNVYGLVIARHFTLTGKYFVQNEKEAVIEPSENFVYDGRVIANPPPGFEDVSSGLPAISQATP